MRKKQKIALIRIIAAILMMAVLHFLPVTGWVKFALFMIPYLTVGYDILIKAVKGIKNLQPFDENFLMAAATVGAIALGDYVEGAAVMIFYQIGELFQSIAVGRSRKNISELMDLRPDYANLLLENGETRQVDPEEVEVGSVIVILPGEKVPIDGIITEGDSSVDTVALTGESVPVTVHTGDSLASGSVNLTGLLRVRTTCPFGESTAAKILDLVENASSNKSHSESFISRFARYYTPVVCIGAVVLAVLPPLARLIMGSSPEWGDWIYRALTFLVISCPCALVISIPLTFFAGLGGAGKQGILVKGSNYMEQLSKTDTVAFDKTGTVTYGVFKVIGIHHNYMDEKLLLEIAAHAEAYSTHPISKSIAEAYGRPVDKTRVSEVHEFAGKGISAMVDDDEVLIGSEKLLEDHGIKAIPCTHAGTIVHVAVDGLYAGHILISDIVKEGAKDAVSSLKRAGVIRTILLTGDRDVVAEAVTKELTIDEYRASLLPQDKVTVIEELLASQRKGRVLAFVGDGINDAPVISRADVGFAMGGLGSNAAIEAADVVLMDDDPRKIAKALRISKKVMRIVWQNIIFAIGIKLVCLLLGALGIANMWLAIFADVGVMVLAVLNAIRALYVRNV